MLIPNVFPHNVNFPYPLLIVWLIAELQLIQCPLQDMNSISEPSPYSHSHSKYICYISRISSVTANPCAAAAAASDGYPTQLAEVNSPVNVIAVVHVRILITANGETVCSAGCSASNDNGFPSCACSDQYIIVK